MKYIKRFNEEVKERSIEDWCNKFNILNYEIIDNSYVKVNGDVYIISEDISKLPIKFNYVGGYFNCSNNRLTTLDGCPDKVGGSFYCGNNKLRKLKGAPKEVGGFFDCAVNQLTYLKDLDIVTVRRYFSCAGNKLKSLEGGPKKVGENYICFNNKLTSLIGCANEVGDLNCSNNKLITLEGCPEKISGYLKCDENPIYEVYRIFKTYDRYKASMDYKYLRGTEIIKIRFDKACQDANINKVPDSIPGYKYI
jgi:hypothetical protein